MRALPDEAVHSPLWKACEMNNLLEDDWSAIAFTCKKGGLQGNPLCVMLLLSRLTERISGVGQAITSMLAAALHQFEACTEGGT